ncbi:MAG: serine/threonine-protein phosphatase, partial [Polyangiaceae bacterium]|nr:serine/threonine-protein phosphatase [Polyangiaceae bacterium]
LQMDEPQHGDVYVLCSDGLSGMVPDEDILDIVVSDAEPEEQCRKLIARANDNGGEDNVTAVVLQVRAGEAGEFAAQVQIRA